jgi:VanZ family protein
VIIRKKNTSTRKNTKKNVSSALDPFSLGSKYVIETKLLKNYLRKSARWWTIWRIATFSFLLILFVTLFPFNFSIKYDFSIRYIVSYFNNPSSFKDVVLNIVLFIPFSFSTTHLLHRRKLNWIFILIAILLASSGLSFMIEVLQIFLPSRSPTLTDIISNTLGGFLGFFLSGQIALKQWNKLHLFKVLTACFIAYTTFILLVSTPLPSTANLRNWDSNFPLQIGNESTGNRPWQGYISNLDIIDRSISKSEVEGIFIEKNSLINFKDSLITSYKLTGENNYQDHVGHSPNLSWQGKSHNLQETKNIFLDSSRWLSTETPASFITEKIRHSSQFTLITTVATANTKQAGSPRIIALSKNPHQRNFMLGQKSSSLVFRLRTPVTENRRDLQLVIPGIFEDTKFHHLIISYANSILKIYVDKPENSYYLELTPGTALFSLIFPIKPHNLETFKDLYYAFIFIPLGVLLGAITTIYRKKSNFYAIFISGGILLPSLCLESILAFGGRRDFSPANLLQGILVVLITMLAIQMIARPYFSRKIILN